MKRLIENLRVGFLLCFILMQGVAPLAHAHVNGQSSDEHVHAQIEGMHHHVVVHADTQAGNIEHDHSLVVTLPPEYRCKDLLFVPVLSSACQMVHPSLQQTVLSYQAVAATVLPQRCFPPQSQAPPV